MPAFSVSELHHMHSCFVVWGAFVCPMAGGVCMDLWNPYGLPLTLVIVAGLFFLISLFPCFYRLPKIEKVP